MSRSIMETALRVIPKFGVCVVFRVETVWMGVTVSFFRSCYESFFGGEMAEEVYFEVLGFYDVCREVIAARSKASLPMALTFELASKLEVL